MWFSKLLQKKKRFVFPLIYLVCNLLLVEPIAKVFGREALPVFNSELRPRNLVYPLLFRNYVNPVLKIKLEDSAHALFTSHHISITYLDANFPFFDSFPLLPHLSHNDGKKIDISFMYLDSDKKTSNKKPSISGYGVFVDSDKNPTSNRCLSQGYWQYDFSKYLTFGTINKLEFDTTGTRTLILNLLSKPSVKKIFIEPHLKESLGLSDQGKIRFHGCHAIRHDDHIHLEIK
ncbi:hypothetical protein EYD45_13095 [Hyunsoonleella flava]|uniref:Uncharacterized protein n=1 Tax=Hyunsoonleella flava TaxID=2527939 RepID=A0A4Q9FDZ6_9FLAO|nr:hypothetical protein EYD45_13095 [Hyunsoonleella flava]